MPLCFSPQAFRTQRYLKGLFFMGYVEAARIIPKGDRIFTWCQSGMMARGFHDLKSVETQRSLVGTLDGEPWFIVRFVRHFWIDWYRKLLCGFRYCYWSQLIDDYMTETQDLTELSLAASHCSFFGINGKTHEGSWRPVRNSKDGAAWSKALLVPSHDFTCLGCRVLVEDKSPFFRCQHMPTYAFRCQHIHFLDANICPGLTDRYQKCSVDDPEMIPWQWCYIRLRQLTLIMQLFFHFS